MKYRLLQIYPGSPEVGDIIHLTHHSHNIYNRWYTDNHYRVYEISEVEEYPTFWEKIEND